MIKFLYVFLGGGLGSLLRYVLSLCFIRFHVTFATLLANILSCVILGCMLLLFHNINLNNNFKLFFIIGLCGGLSTFSSFSYETVNLLKSGYFGCAILNIFISMLLCFSMIYFFIRKL